jgi:hypothetical protein
LARRWVVVDKRRHRYYVGGNSIDVPNTSGPRRRGPNSLKENAMLEVTPLAIEQIAEYFKGTSRAKRLPP